MSELAPAAARAFLVESITVGLEDLRGTPGVQYTEEALVRLTRAAQSTIDLTAMYWALLPDPASDDEKGFTDSQFEAMGAGAGRALYQALRDARPGRDHPHSLKPRLFRPKTGVRRAKRGVSRPRIDPLD